MLSRVRRAGRKRRRQALPIVIPTDMAVIDIVGRWIDLGHGASIDPRENVLLGYDIQHESSKELVATGRPEIGVDEVLIPDSQISYHNQNLLSAAQRKVQPFFTPHKAHGFRFHPRLCQREQDKGCFLALGGIDGEIVPYCQATLPQDARNQLALGLVGTDYHHILRPNLLTGGTTERVDFIQQIPDDHCLLPILEGGAMFLAGGVAHDADKDPHTV